MLTASRPLHSQFFARAAPSRFHSILPPRHDLVPHMPLTLALTEGILPKGQEKVAFTCLPDAMLKWHGLSGNAVMTPNGAGWIHVVSQQKTWASIKRAARSRLAGDAKRYNGLCTNSKLPP